MIKSTRMFRRRVIALVTIYVLFLQGLFAAVAVSVAAAGGVAICTSAASDESGAALGGHDSCLNCAMCAQAAAPGREGRAIVWRAGSPEAAASPATVAPWREPRPPVARAPPAA